MIEVSLKERYELGYVMRVFNNCATHVLEQMHVSELCEDGGGEKQAAGTFLLAGGRWVLPRKGP